MSKTDDWTPRRLLENWGLRQFGALRSPIHLSTGGDSSTDDESQAVFYLEHTEGFEAARPVLSWVYSEYKSLKSFRIVDSGVTICVDTLARMGWGQFPYGTELKAMPYLILDQFERSLAERSRTNPFVPVRAVEEEESVEQVKDRQEKETLRELVAQKGVAFRHR